ncbi:MAG: hypothetical protein A2V90_03115 [Gammaproteobacteria bacterium RBG_16_57_12]|nr:MAG: hypothetical protein A2V90_03115 [Gammaproteobacteria bacterium RBG_16_57_12]
MGANNASTVRPNINFIIDTSGSMDTNVLLPGPSYDPGTTYTGSCVNSRVYYSSSGTTPTCSTNNYIDKTSYQCNNATSSLDSTGYVVDRHARYKKGNGTSYSWSTLSSSNHTDTVECKADWGVHGNGGANTYPANSNKGGPYRVNSTDAIAWGSTGLSYTFYSANYVNYKNGVGAPVYKTRLKIVQEVFKSLVDSTSGVNASLMRFSQNGLGGYFVLPMQEVNAASRPSFKTAVDAMTASGDTPLAETLYESVLYYRGGTVDFGDSSTPATNVSGVFSGSNYVSPIEYQCQRSFTVLLTDGDPTNDGSADTKIQALPGLPSTSGTCSFGSGDDCLDELADYTYKTDQSSSKLDVQNIITYTIGFASNQILLKDTATKGGGKYYTADDTSTLTDAFTQILTDIIAINDTFVSPAVSVNVFNRLDHLDDLYYAVFRPSLKPAWDGNVKKYKLAPYTISGNTEMTIVDANGDPAIDANTGFFKSGSSAATSYWTSGADAPDGDIVAMGGAASKMTTSRNVYTYTGGLTTISNVNLTLGQHALSEGNTANITKALLGLPESTSTADHEALLKWARGVDLYDEDGDEDTTDARRSMGDPLHSKAVLVTYGGTTTSPDITMYLGTNEGYLHAINVSNGTEQFAFMPQELLPNLNTLQVNASTSPHPYGLDGGLTAWVYDADKDGSIEAGDHVYLYVGMRRGGRNYYALDVTNRTQPKLMWEIRGGTGDFAELSQSWSKPQLGKIKLNGADKTVLIFGGGYDTDQDGNNTLQDDDTGRAIYIVDAVTGQRLWWAGKSGANLSLSEMKNSIPADVRILDVNNDKYTDQIYVGDMGGRIWRIDLKLSNTGANTLATGGMIANLSDGTPAGNRRFYYAPDAVYMKPDLKAGYLAINIGSGYREHPLSTAIEDRFYSLKLTDVFSAPSSYVSLTESNLYDATENLVLEASTEAQRTDEVTALNAASGWFIKLNKITDGSFIGEKVLAEAITLQGKVYFSTFTPVGTADATSCAPSMGDAKMYIVNVADATPIYDYDATNAPEMRSDRYYDLKKSGIPPAVSFVMIDGQVTPLGGTETLPGEPISTTERIYWIQDQ